jgi:hypothetical protein
MYHSTNFYVLSCPVWPLTFWPQNQQRSCTPSDTQSTKFYVCQAKSSQDIEQLIHSYVLFDPWSITSSLIGVTDSLGCSSVSNLMSFKHRVLKILSSQYIPISSLTLNLWPFDHKINRVHLLFRIYKFEVCQAKGFNILSGQHIPFSSFDQPWPLIYWPPNQ